MLKKIIFFTALLCSLNLNLSISTKNQDVKKMSAIVPVKNYCELGKGMDVATDSFYYPSNIKTDADIFDSAWLNSRIEKGAVTQKNRGKFYKSSGTSLSSFSMNYGQTIESLTNLNVGSNEFMASVNNKIASENDSNVKQNLSYFFYNLTYTSIEYSKSLSNSANYELYRDHLDSGYVQNIGNLLNGSLFYNDFFGAYGTHIISSIQYGTSYNVTYTASSNSYDFESNTQINYSNVATAKFKYDGVPIDASSSTGHTLDFSIDSDKYSYIDSVSVESIGGDTKYAFSDLSSFEKNIGEWLDSRDGSEVMVYCNSYIPIWKMLPREYNTTDNRNKIEDYYNKYLEENYLKSIEPFGSFNEYSTEIKLIDEAIKVQGSFQKKAINFESDLLAMIDYNNRNTLVKNKENNINDLIDFNLLKKRGFKTISFKIKFTVAEIDDGIRTIGIFNLESKKKAEDALFLAKSEGSDGVRKDGIRYVVDFDDKKVNISDFNDIIYIRFGSTGNAFNAYKISKVTVSMSFYK